MEKTSVGGSGHARRHRLTATEKEKLVALYKEGASRKQLVEKFNISLSSVYNITSRARKNGDAHSFPAKWHRLTSEEKEEAAALYRDGTSCRQIAEKYNVSLYSARNATRKERGKRKQEKDMAQQERRRTAAENRRYPGSSGAYCTVTEKLSENICLLIRKFGLTQQKLSDATGISIDIIRGMMSGDSTSRCHRTSLANMASAFGISSDLLLNGDAGELKDAAVAPHHVGSSGYSQKAAITKETRDEIVRLYNSGYGKRRIAEEVAVSLASVKSIIKKARSSGEAVQRGHGGSYKLTDAQIDQAVGMYETGVSTFQIAKMFGVNQKTICNYIRRKKAKQQSRQEARRA